MSKSSMILGLSLILASSVTYAGEPNQPSNVIERLITEIENNYDVNCEGEEFVRCLHADGREITLNFGAESEEEFTLDVTVRGREITDLSLMRLSDELVAEINAELAGETAPVELTEEMNQQLEAFNTKLDEQAEQLQNQKQGTQKAPADIKFKKFKYRKPNESNPQKRLKHVRRRSFTACPVGPRIKHRKVKVRHAPRAKSPSNKAGK